MPVIPDPHRIAAWLWSRLESGSAIPLAELLNDAQHAGLWPWPAADAPKRGLGPFYRARDLVASQHPGWYVAETTLWRGRLARKRWRLVRIDPIASVPITTPTRPAPPISKADYQPVRVTFREPNS